MADLQVSDPSPGLTDVPGFRAAGVHCDVRGKRDGRLDLALVVSERDCTAAMVTTQHDFAAAPVRLCRKIFAEGGPFRGLVANSGNANACTGRQGALDAHAMALSVEDLLNLGGGSVFVGSTGRIGRALPMANLSAGIKEAAQTLSNQPAQGEAAADAILTSDTRRKTLTVRFEHEGKMVTVAGMAKGAGMIEPNMATMFGFMATDAQVAPELLQKILIEANRTSFNAVTIDGDRSTNDIALLLANAASGISVSEDNPALRETFAAAVTRVAERLAEKMVADGERVTKFVTLNVEGCRSDTEAEAVARAIGNSLLVKSSWFGSDPNWGRLMDAAGYAGAGLVEDQIDLFYDDCPVLLQGAPQEDNHAQWERIVARKKFSITLKAQLGAGRHRLFSTDLSTGYVDFNKSE